MHAENNNSNLKMLQNMLTLKLYTLQTVKVVIMKYIIGE